MSCLFLSVSANEFALGDAELSKYPNSLLSSLVSSFGINTAGVSGDETSQHIAQYTQAGDNSLTAPVYTSSSSSCWSAVDGGWRLDLEAMDLPIKGHFKVLDLTTAARLLHAMYRQDSIPSETWEPLLSSCPPDAPVSKQSQHDGLLFADVTKLLDYFNLPGPATRWLPPLETLHLQQWRLLALSYTWNAVYNAKKAVDTMMNYMPHQQPQHPPRTAAFVLHKNQADNTAIAGLQVHVLQPMTAGLLSWIEDHNNHKLDLACCGQATEPFDFGTFTGVCGDARVCALTSEGTLVPPTSQSGKHSPLPGFVYEHPSIVGIRDYNLGRTILQALQDAIQDTRIIVGYGCMNSRVAYTDTRVDVPVWVLRW